MDNGAFLDLCCKEYKWATAKCQENNDSCERLASLLRGILQLHFILFYLII